MRYAIAALTLFSIPFSAHAQTTGVDTTGVHIADSVESIDVQANVTRSQLRLEVQLRGSLPNFVEAKIPREESDVCTYVRTEFNQLEFGDTPSDTNPAESCSGQANALLYTILCENAEPFSEEITFTTSEPAAASGITLLTLNNDDSAFVDRIENNHVCSTSGTAPGHNKIALRVPGSAKEFSGSVGTVLIQLNY